MNIKSALKEWDGKSAADIKAIYDIYQTELNFVNDIVELSFICDYENAATWLLKAWLEDGNQLKQSQIKTICCSLNQLQHWQAKLHLLQCIPYMPIAEAENETLHTFLRMTLTHQNKFVRAWSYNGFYELSKSYPQYKTETKQYFELAMRDEAPSVKARIRNIMKKGF
jgi:hypothetical protein